MEYSLKYDNTSTITCESNSNSLTNDTICCTTDCLETNKHEDIETGVSDLDNYKNALENSINNSLNKIEKNNFNKDRGELVKDLKYKSKKSKNENDTYNSKVKSNVYEFNKLKHDISLLKTSCIVLFINLIIAVSYIPCFSPLAKKGAMIMWTIIIACLSGYYLYNRNFKDLTRDDRKYNEFNFKKPTQANILSSKEVAIKENQEELAKLDVDFDPSSIDIGNIQQYISSDSCSAN